MMFQIPKEAMNFSHPGLCVTVAEEVAWLKNIPVRTVLEACIENTKDMYGIWIQTLRKASSVCYYLKALSLYTGSHVSFVDSSQWLQIISVFL